MSWAFPLNAEIDAGMVPEDDEDALLKTDGGTVDAEGGDVMLRRTRKGCKYVAQVSQNNSSE